MTRTALELALLAACRSAAREIATGQALAGKADACMQINRDVAHRLLEKLLAAIRLAQ